MSQTSTKAAGRTAGEPAYRFGRHTDAYDIRVYEPEFVAEVIVSGPAESASSEGFRLLAVYIFRGNGSSQKAAMTAPDTQSPVMRPMTVPNDPRVKLRAIPAQRLAVRRCKIRSRRAGASAGTRRFQR